MVHIIDFSCRAPSSRFPEISGGKDQGTPGRVGDGPRLIKMCVEWRGLSQPPERRPTLDDGEKWS